MSENQKEEKVITNSQSNQQNQNNLSNPSNQDYREKNSDASQKPDVVHEDKIQTEVPKQHHTEEQERFRKTPVAGQEQQEENDDENQQEEFENSAVDGDRSNKQEATK